LYWLVANLSQRSPVLVAIDDVQWADASSLRWLHYLAPRMRGLGVVLLLAVRASSRAAPAIRPHSAPHASLSSTACPAGIPASR
jgi:hypothetical protein